MFQILSTPQSRVSAKVVIGALVITPVVNTLLGNTVCLHVVNYLIAVVVGGGIGWVAGDAFTQSSTLGKVITGISAAVVPLITNLVAISKALQEAGQTQEGSLLYELFVKPFQNPTFLAALQYGSLAFIIVFVLAIFYIKSNSTGKNTGAASSGTKTTP
jgi:hypothetical protein